MFSGPASRCVRSPGNRARPGESDRKAGPRAARTSAMKRGVRAAGAASARLWGRPLGKRWRAHLPASCDKKSGIPWNVPFFDLGLATDLLLPRHLENDFQLDRGAERKACDAIHQAARALVFSKDVLQQLRSGVRDFWLIADISRSGYRHAEPDDPRHFVERSQMLPRDSEDVERREVSRLAPRFYIELRADAPNEFCPVTFRGKHPAQKKQIARLHRFHIGTERLRRRREFDAKFFQPLLGADRPRAFVGSHLLFRMCIHVSLSNREMNPGQRQGAVIGCIASVVDQPNVNAKASTPASRNSISNCRSAMGFGCRIS